MFKNYFKVALRNIQKHKGYSFINIIGLAVGIACCLLIFSWTRCELSFDSFHKNAREICRVISEFHSPGGEINYSNTNQAPLAAVLKDRYPEIVNSTRAVYFDIRVGKQGSRFEEKVWIVDPSFLEMFTFSFIQGDPATALAKPESIVLTETLAGKHFQNEDPMGKTIIVGTFVINKQLHLIRNKNLGYNKENIICINAVRGISQNYSTVKNTLQANPNILGMTIVDSFLDAPNSSATSDVIHWEWQRADESIPWLIVKGVDSDFQKIFGIEMSEGRFFSEEFPSDRKEGMVVNEAAVRAMNMNSPIGKKFHFWDFDGIIIGVIKDFHFKSLYKQIEPMVMKIGINPQKIAIRIKSDNIAATIEFIEREIKKIVPNYTFEFEFLDQKLNRLYRAEQRMENITQAISFLAIFISCLGLLALTAFTAEKKKKEIGIRKVLGASVSSVVYLLSLKYE